MGKSKQKSLEIILLAKQLISTLTASNISNFLPLLNVLQVRIIFTY